MEENKENVMEWTVEDVGKEMEGKLTHLTVRSSQLSCF